MATLLEDIRSQSEWLIKAFKGDGLKLDYSMQSLKVIDTFFDTHSQNGQPIAGGRLSQNMGLIIFSIGAYIGETFIKNSPGAFWKTDDNDSEGEVNAEIHLADGTICWPMQRAFKRFSFGSDEGIYFYGQSIIPHPTISNSPRSWWQFWK